MKFNLNKGVVTLASETEAEALELFRIAVKTTDVFAPQIKKHKPHKKHEFLKRCEICGKGWKGIRSLGLHKYKAHGIKGAQWVANHKYYLKQKASQSKPVDSVKTQFENIWNLKP